MAGEDDVNEGPLESLQGAILDVIALYADKHDEDFEPFFPTFAGDVWTLLSGSTTNRIMATPMDALVVKAVKFLAASVAKAIHVEFFAVRMNACCLPRAYIAILEVAGGWCIGSCV
jgi:hypothetical protein